MELNIASIIKANCLGDIAAAFTNLNDLTAIVERSSFSSMKLVNTRLQIRMGEQPPESTKRICIEGSRWYSIKFDVCHHFSGLSFIAESVSGIC